MVLRAIAPPSQCKKCGPGLNPGPGFPGLCLWFSSLDKTPLQITTSTSVFHSKESIIFFTFLFCINLEDICRRTFNCLAS